MAASATNTRTTEPDTVARKPSARKTTTAKAAKPAAAKTPDQINRTQVLKEMRRELVAGPPEAALLHALSLAEFAERARRVHGTFPMLSTNNRLLLESQRRRLSESWKWLFAGKDQWAKLGRTVRTDATVKTIWLPRIAKVDNPQPGEDDTEFRGFIARAVYYDYTDTVATDPDFVEPNWDVPLAVGNRATLDALVDVAVKLGLTVRFEDWAARNENGALYADGRIVVDESLPLGNQIKVLARQLGVHHLSHTAKVAAASAADRSEVAETCAAEAALTELLTMKMLGLDESVGNEVTASAANYLRNWVAADGTAVEGHKKRIELLEARIQPALAAASAVIDSYLDVTGAAPVPA
jgi:hypothetical protein